jgi:hypothetical protein
MGNRFVGASLFFTVFLALPAFSAQTSGVSAPKVAPAPRRDLSGVWSGGAVMRLEPFAPMTPWAQKLYDEARPLFGPRAFAVGASNDGLVTCDPLGFPRDILYEMRGIEFAHLGKKTLQLFQYQRIWREIWTDGRKLETNAGHNTQDSPDARWYGYSVGAWADDYTFVVNTTGFNEKSWADPDGHPRSVDARVEERYRRIDHDNLEVTVTIDDPKAYTKPFVAMKQVLHWNPKQEFEEQLCVPSEAADYLDTFRPAAEQPK